MRYLIIGGSQFLGAKVVEELYYAKHDVALFDASPPPPSVAKDVTHIVGDKGSLAFYKDEIEAFEPDTAIHLNAVSSEDAATFVETFKDMVSHLVVTSNTNVYRAHARLRKTEPGPSLSVPINEESPLREKPLKEEGAPDKIDVEAIIQKCETRSTILRMAPIYGPNDFLRRFYPLMVRMIDDRPHIVLGDAQADWKWSHIFVDDAAHAVAMAAMNHGEESVIYNVAELKTPTFRERVEHIATVFGWEGRIGTLPEKQLPEYMRTPGDFAQDLEIDSSRIRKQIGFKEVTDYYDGLAAAVEWYKDNPPPEMAGQNFNYEAEDKISSLAFK